MSQCWHIRSSPLPPLPSQGQLRLPVSGQQEGEGASDGAAGAGRGVHLLPGPGGGPHEGGSDAL